MAKRVIHELIDDVNGQPADEPLTFALDGVQYEIDLTAKNATKLRQAVAPFVEAGTKVGRGAVVAGRGRSRDGRRGSTNDRQLNQKIREWAQQQNLEIADRGRI